ncbi:hypothetical protein B5M47_03545 [candidate division CPR3 bacterium 4484_211]|uniref:GxxExxY protein n=1 Tax=candidate division CPR3 bacterium 4484_211 TaxID=1968527 RepID=A0A1W9NX91_UNCC3|nr:MAG: hypothetical protein B5M47_03545 [candidate division CPR3 bacterium 4484_211]
MSIRPKIIYPKLSYIITGLCFSIHNEYGRFLREKQYATHLETKLKEEQLNYQREVEIGDSHNIVDFIIEDKIILELKAKRAITKKDYYQTQRYLQETGIKLGLLINFRNKFLKPKRIIKIDTPAKIKYQ